MINRFFRAYAIMDGLPLSLPGFAPGELEPLLAAFWERYTPTSIYDPRESVAFGLFVLTRIDAGELDNPVLADLLRYELAEIELRLGGGSGADPGVPVLDDPHAQAPCCRPELRVVAMTHEPSELLRRARARAPLDDVPRRPGFLLLRALGPGLVGTAPLLPELGEVLRECTGRRSAAEVAAVLERPVDELQQLAQAGYVTFVERAGSR